MQLQEQLTELRENILRDKSDLVAGDRDSLWSDETLLQYIKRAEWRFARDTFVLRDSTTPDVTRLTLALGQNVYPLHRSVIGVLGARAGNNQVDLKRSGHALVNDVRQVEFEPYDPRLSYGLPPGEPLVFFTDETNVYASKSRVTFTVYPQPSVEVVGTPIHLRVIRLPICGYTQDDLKRESEFADDYAADLLEWAAYLAMRTFDADAGAPTTAEDHRRAYLDMVERAKTDMRANAFATTAIRYGANGFSWTR